MNKIIVFIYVVALISFVGCFIKKADIFTDITNDIDSNVYISIGMKEYDKETIIKYYKQTIRYIYYFIYFYDIENLETVIE